VPFKVRRVPARSESGLWGVVFGQGVCIWSPTRDMQSLVSTNIQILPVAELRLDPDNPRLPADIQGGEEPAIIRYLWDNAALDELVQSFVDNGFFEHEPLIGVAETGGCVILEGNRRLSALKILLGEPAAADAGIEARLDQAPSSEQLRHLRHVPVYVVADREEVHKYLGFRHIGGIKTWSAEAKARYLMLETDRAHEAGVEQPFLEVARRVGSNSQGVRNSYTAIGLLRHARASYGIDVNEVLERRFGVWTRCMTASDVRHYIGLNGARGYDDVREDIEAVEEGPLREVVGDLTSRKGRPPLLRDSRLVTVYGRILQHPVAHDVLRRHEDLDVARQVVDMAELPDRLLDLRHRVDLARAEAERSEYAEDLMDAAEALFRAARSLRSTVQDLAED
jgi:hypothetical protein